MSYFKDETKGQARGKRNSDRLSILSDTSGRDPGSPFIKFYELEPAHVISVINDQDDPDFESYADIGKVKFRYLYSDTKRSTEDLPLAYPLDSSISEFPLPNEVVVIAEYLGDYYYTRRLNLFNLTNNNIFGQFNQVTKTDDSQQDNLNTYEKSNQGFPKNQKQNSPYDKFRLNNDGIRPIKHEQGDTIYYGRFGNFIKFSSNDNNEPNIKIVAGQSPENAQATEDVREPISEDINNDRSSIWLTQNLDISFTPSTVDTEEHLRSYVGKKPSMYDGEQIIINSDRIILNSKSRDIFLYGGDGIGVVSGDILGIDAVSDINVNTTENLNVVVTGSYESEVNEESLHTYNSSWNLDIGNEWNAQVATSINFNSPEIELGNPQNTQRMVLGEDFNEALLELVSSLLENQSTFVSTATGPGALTPSIVRALQKIRTSLQTQKLLSRKNRSQ